MLDDGLQRLATLEQAATAAVLVNLGLPDSQGIDTFDRLFNAAPRTPIVVLSTSLDEALGRLAVEHGAQDYLLKEHIDAYFFPKALLNMIERAANAEALFADSERAQFT